MEHSTITTTKLVNLSDCSLHGKTLRGGVLLQWMDIVACLAAEKHAERPCVTVCVDDLHLEKTVSCGEVLVLVAKVTRAFTTSLEVEVVTCSEEIETGDRIHICRAFFTFVAQPTEDGGKAQLRPIIPRTEDEKIQYQLAGERKNMRVDYKGTLSDMKKKPSRCNSIDEPGKEINKDGKEVLSPVSTMSECVEIVLPQHANHHKTTFGGQLMAWMEITGTIAARRLCRCQPVLVAVDEVFFRGPSHVGDRVIIKSLVNNTFGKSMEIGVRVEAYEVGGPLRHIESAYFTFIAPDEGGNPKSLPELRSRDPVIRQRMERATTRKRLRQQRKAVLQSPGDDKSIVWHPDINNAVSYKNLRNLIELYHLSDWKTMIGKQQFQIFSCLKGECLCVKVEATLPLTQQQVYSFLADDRNRLRWDSIMVDIKVMETVNSGKDTVLHYIVKNLVPETVLKCDDFVMLASKRTPVSPGDPYVIVYRSIKYEPLPPASEYNRIENRCSGFIMDACEDSNSCKLVYLNQMTDKVFAYIKNDMKGTTQVQTKRTEDLIRGLLRYYGKEA